MDVKRYDLVGEYECDIQELEDGDYVLYDDIKHLLTRPDPAEVERAIDELIGAACAYQREGVIDTHPRLKQARAELLKAIGGE